MDFSDIINNAYEYLDKLKDKFKLKYLLIDEYQDISIQRFKFVKKISDIFNTKIVAVGDDWQSIYSFSGSNIDMFKRFNELMGYSSIIRIQNTYRNSQELLDLTTSFVSKDISTFKKNLKSNKHFDNPIEICYYNYEINNKIDCLVDIIKSIYKNHPNDKILILGRFNQEKEELLNSGSFSILNDKLICNIVKANIDFLSVHSSKGLGYDYVIILNALNSKYGFPSKIEDDALLKLLNNKEKYKYAEERRLFYVALTRTKNKVYILCPDRIDKRSEFVIELENERRKYERSI